MSKIEKEGKIDESFVHIEPKEAMYAFGAHGEELPSTAIHGYEQLVKVYQQAMKSTGVNGKQALSNK